MIKHIQFGSGISVIIPAFNRIKMLRNTLAGLLMQENYPHDFEVIIVDNGSTENIKKNILDFSAYMSIKLIRRNILYYNFRPGSARNIGVINSKGSS